MKENETEESVSECNPDNVNPDITIDVVSGKVSLDFDKGEWLLLLIGVGILSSLGVIAL